MPTGSRSWKRCGRRRCGSKGWSPSRRNTEPAGARPSRRDARAERAAAWKHNGGMATPVDSPKLRKVRIATLVLAVVAVILLACAGPGTRMGIWPWKAGLLLLSIAAGLGVAVALVAL